MIKQMVFFAAGLIRETFIVIRTKRLVLVPPPMSHIQSLKISFKVLFRIGQFARKS
jgi:hypothetical protein